MSIQQTPYSLRVDPALMAKFKVIAKENGRSVNKEIESIMRKAVREYEQQNGRITVQPDFA